MDVSLIKNDIMNLFSGKSSGFRIFPNFPDFFPEFSLDFHIFSESLWYSKIANIKWKFSFPKFIRFPDFPRIFPDFLQIWTVFMFLLLILKLSFFQIMKDNYPVLDFFWISFKYSISLFYYFLINWSVFSKLIIITNSWF